MGKLLKKTEDQLKKTGHSVEEKASAAGHKVVEATKAAGHKTAEVTKAAGHKTVEVTKAAGHKTVEVSQKAVGRMDVTCDKCGKLMTPGGEFTRVIRGKEYQFCSVLCADHFHPPMKGL